MTTIREYLDSIGNWQPVSLTRFCVFSAGLAFFVLVILMSEKGFIPVLDGANLLFHEAGHPVFGILGSTMGLYGGTLGQLVFPLVVTAGFWKQRSPVSFAVGLIWFFENFFNIARYVDDARAQILPLVGGGEHDWFNILYRWHALPYDTTIANVVIVIGWLGIVVTWLWLGWRTLQTYKNSPSP